MSHHFSLAEEPSRTTYLLDVNALIAALWITHADHRKTDGWLVGKSLAVCPLTEIGFLRISSHPRALRASMADAEALLNRFYTEAKPEFVPADISARCLGAKNSDAVTDTYLVRLAEKHKMKLATLDARIGHPAVELIQ